MKQHLSISIFTLLLIKFVVLVNVGCEGQDYEYLGSVLSGEYKILGGIEGHDINFLVLQTDNTPLNDNHIIIFNKSNEIINYLFQQRGTSRFPVALNDQFIAYGAFSKEGEAGKWIVLYNKEMNQFVEFNSSYFFIGDLFLNEGKLYFSAEKANPNLNYYDISAKVIERFGDVYLPGASFYNVDNRVYAYQYRVDPNHRYLISGNKVVKEDYDVSSIQAENYVIDDFEISTEIVKQLKF